MRKILTLIPLGIAGWMLAGCEQAQDDLEPATGFPQNEVPRTDPDLQIGQGDPIEEPEPISPNIEREIEPTVIRPDEEGGAGEIELEELEPDPASPPPQN